ncbi:MAG: hypothetical protein R3D84_17570 [Paracoccaceae bacterium]
MGDDASPRRPSRCASGWKLAACVAPGSAPAPDSFGRAAALAAKLADTTQAQHDRFFGTQIEYLAPDGRSRLWAAGRAGIVDGQWLTRAGPRPGEAAQLCFRYGADRALAVDPAQGGNWTCRDGAGYLGTRSGSAAGDPLGLATGRPLPPLPADRAIGLAEAAGIAAPG